jgi:hypothetical protein
MDLGLEIDRMPNSLESSGLSVVGLSGAVMGFLAIGSVSRPGAYENGGGDGNARGRPGLTPVRFGPMLETQRRSAARASRPKHDHEGENIMGTKGIAIVDMDVKKLVAVLNKAFSDEWLAYYQYWMAPRW